MSKTIDTDSLAMAAQALSTYMGEVQQSVKQMQDAALDCSDNLEKDVYTTEAINGLEKCIKELKKCLIEAEELRGKIVNRYREILESQKRVR